MKSRLSSTIWTLIILNAFAFVVVLALAYNAGRQSSGGAFDASGLIIPGIVAIGISIILAWRLGGSILSPISELADFSERLAAGDAKARADVTSNDEFGYIAENLNRAVAKVSKASSNQEANESLQRRRRTHRFQETGFEQRRSERGSRPPRSRRRGAGQPRRP